MRKISLQFLGKFLPYKIKGKVGLYIAKNASRLPIFGLPLIKLIWGHNLNFTQLPSGDLCVDGMEFPKGSLPAYLNIYVDKVYDTFGEPQEGNTVIDIGACTGLYSVKVAKLVGPTGSVISIEPSPEVLPLLYKNLSPYPNTRIVTKAISKGPNEQNFFLSGMHGGFTSYKTKEVILVESETLDSIVKELELERVNFIKTNTAFSMNLDVLQSALSTLQRWMPQVVIYAPYEIQGRRKGLKALVEFLQALGYEVVIKGICIYTMGRQRITNE